MTSSESLNDGVGVSSHSSGGNTESEMGSGLVGCHMCKGAQVGKYSIAGPVRLVSFCQSQTTEVGPSDLCTLNRQNLPGRQLSP